MKHIQFGITALVVLITATFVATLWPAGEVQAACPPGGFCPAPINPDDIVVVGEVDLFPPRLPEGCLTWAGETLCPPGVSPEPVQQDAGEPEAVTCHIDGCEIPIVFVTDDGEVAKTMVITFVDAVPVE